MRISRTASPAFAAVLAGLLLPGCWPGIPIAVAASSGGDGGSDSSGPPPTTGPDPLFGAQWHLQNTGQLGATPGEDAHVVPVWEQGFVGAGHLIAIVDDGLEIAHEDLAANVAPGLSFNYANGSNDPTPPSLPFPPPTSLDEIHGHGTSVGGVAAARGQNGLGVSGAAPEARLVGYNFLGVGSPASEATLVDALTRNVAQVSVSNNSWGPALAGFLSPKSSAYLAAIQTGLASGRGGLGTIYMFAAGNSGSFCPGAVSPSDQTLFGYDNTNNSGLGQTMGVMYVAAVGSDGVVADYSTGGASVWISAHSQGNNGQAITTTDRTGLEGYNPFFSGNYADLDYTDTFNGTSAATPLASGVAALVLAARPSLSWRDLRVLLARTARQSDFGHPGWFANGAGHPFNHRYGFGLVDADAAVEAALGHQNLPQLEQEAQTSSPFLAIPDANAAGVSDTIAISGSGITEIEWVNVTFSAANHTYFADLRVVLESPAGTQCVLAWPHLLIDPDDPCTLTAPFSGMVYDDWVFATGACLDEGADGTWTLSVSDEAAGDVGTFQSWTLTVQGH